MNSPHNGGTASRTGRRHVHLALRKRFGSLAELASPRCQQPMIMLATSASLREFRGWRSRKGSWFVGTVGATMFAGMTPVW